MADINACLLRNNSAANMSSCWDEANYMLNNSLMALKYWTNTVESSGGLTATMNRTE